MTSTSTIHYLRGTSRKLRLRVYPTLLYDKPLGKMSSVNQQTWNLIIQFQREEIGEGKTLQWADDNESNQKQQSLSQSLLTADDHVSQFVADYIHEVNRISEFFKAEVAIIRNDLYILKAKYQGRLQQRADESAEMYHQGMQLGEEKDEFEYAISWKRAFFHIYQRVTWINSFALTNSIVA